MEQMIWVLYLCASIGANGKCTADLATPMPAGEQQCLAHAAASTPPVTGFIICQQRKVEAKAEGAAEQPK